MSAWFTPAISMACRRLPARGFVEPVEIALPEAFALFLSGILPGMGIEYLLAALGTKVDIDTIVACLGSRSGWIHGHPAHRVDEIMILGLDGHRTPSFGITVF